MEKYNKLLIILIPIYLYFFVQGFYVVIYKESPIARIMAIIGMLGFTFLLTAFITTVLTRNKKERKENQNEER
ncbi:hypothetical protein DOS74_08570 [Staphylococcus felis]|uniref:Uncharacterized protein n=1 Tax=Staphylococcus felis TaxID=46127 RepID=A0AAX1RXQ4_9STAP|nr:hypothetical protein [Staphylococcus felis]MBH9579943.1 hypothetical protein [Staphylococcus felis]REH79156.1 hypothetical protein DOS59_03865 [Staphylococcus felis]REH82564.1 hypothetical protein DOS56_07920 [Staphylococcus felis]REH85416.1 hypothetical protein DOS63_05220 [Staphylococcus felis]REH99175.1 hypothetical protein DOS64_09540 [Staphylococcus felis]